MGGAARREEVVAVGARGFNAARGFVGGAAATRLDTAPDWVLVSMPHAALLVVQPTCKSGYEKDLEGFNAARGFVGGAALLSCA